MTHQSTLDFSEIESGQFDRAESCPSSTEAANIAAPADDQVHEQLSLVGINTGRKIHTKTPRMARKDFCPCPDDIALIELFERSLNALGRAKRGMSAYTYQLRSIISVASRIAGRSISLAELFNNGELLGRALIDDQSTTGFQLSKYTLDQRRSAVRSFASLLSPELRAFLDEDPTRLIDRSLQVVAERVGTGFRLSTGRPRNRGGRVPSREDFRSVFDALGLPGGFIGIRNIAFFTFLFGTACRVNEVRVLDGSDFIIMPNGRVRLFIREKRKSEPREVELSIQCTEMMREYFSAINLASSNRHQSCQVGFGIAGSIWKNKHFRQMSYRETCQALTVACHTADVTRFTAHAFRHAFASFGASRLSRFIVAPAGGWDGTERMDDHYVKPIGESMSSKLSGFQEPPVSTAQEIDNAASTVTSFQYGRPVAPTEATS